MQLKYAQINSGVTGDAVILGRNLHSDGDHLSLLILVISAPDNFEVRSRFRNYSSLDCSTHESFNCQTVFVIGTTINNTGKSPSWLKVMDHILFCLLVSQKVNMEADIHRDILVPDFLDSYNNLTLKSLHAIKYFLRQKKFTHMLKVDDNCFVNLNALKTVLQSKYPKRYW